MSQLFLHLLLFSESLWTTVQHLRKSILSCTFHLEIHRKSCWCDLVTFQNHPLPTKQMLNPSGTCTRVPTTCRVSRSAGTCPRGWRRWRVCSGWFAWRPAPGPPRRSSRPPMCGWSINCYLSYLIYPSFGTGMTTGKLLHKILFWAFKCQQQH